MEQHFLCISVIIILVIILLYNYSKENFNNTFYQSMLRKDIGTMKDKKGYTLEDYALAQNALYGTKIDNSLSSVGGKILEN